MKTDLNYDFLLKTLNGPHWKKLGTVRRAGVAFPLFSCYSKNSTGIGEIPDLKLLIDWCKICGMSLLQLLPLNDVGLRFTPYDAESTFALEPAYLSLTDLEGVDVKPERAAIASLRKQYPFKGIRVNYGIKNAKLDLLRRFFESCDLTNHRAFNAFLKQNLFWLSDYALFKTIKDSQQGKSWEDWPPVLKNRDASALQAFAGQHSRQILFYQWLQYQLFVQFQSVRKHAERQGVFLMGDLPFLVSRDSADVWAHPEYFKLELSSGAPPDLYFSLGQRWGMPPYRWESIARRGYDYLIEKLRYAQNFYDLYRIDHVVGIFRVWTIPLSEPYEHQGLYGTFDPADESLWEAQGRKVLSLMIQNSEMLPCAEDLGVVPDCAVRVLGEFGIPGMDVQRWRRDWSKSYDFLPPETYRPVSIALMSTHDMGAFKEWWDEEAGTVDAAHFKRTCAENGISFESLGGKLFENPEAPGRLRWRSDLDSVPRLLDVLGLPEDRARAFLDFYKPSFDEFEKFWKYSHPGTGPQRPMKKSSPALIEAALRSVHQAQSIFSIQMFTDLLSLDPEIHQQAGHLKVNSPGTFGAHNWSSRLPWPLETLLEHPANEKLRALHQETGRI